MVGGGVGAGMLMSGGLGKVADRQSRTAYDGRLFHKPAGSPPPPPLFPPHPQSSLYALSLGYFHAAIGYYGVCVCVRAYVCLCVRARVCVVCVLCVCVYR